MTTEQKHTMVKQVHQIEIPGLPEGYRLVRVEITNDRYRNDDGTSTIRGCSIVIEKIQQRRIVFVEIPIAEATDGDYILSKLGSWELMYSRGVKEGDTFYRRVVEEE